MRKRGTLDPTIATILLEQDLRGETARNFGAAVSLIFEIVQAGGALPFNRLAEASRLPDSTTEAFLSRFATLFEVKGDMIGSHVATAILERASLASVLMTTLSKREAAEIVHADGATKPSKAPRAPKPTEEPLGAYTAEFEAFWTAYAAIGGTTRRNKQLSFARWKKAITFASVAEIMSGLERFAAFHIAEIKGSPAKAAFVMMPTTWLFNREWAAEYPMPAGTPMTQGGLPKNPERKDFGSPKPKTDFHPMTVELPSGGTGQGFSVYPSGWVPFREPAWLELRGASQEICAKEWERLGYSKVPRDDPEAGLDFEQHGQVQYWPKTDIEFDEALWRAGHGSGSVRLS